MRAPDTSSKRSRIRSRSREAVPEDRDRAQLERRGPQIHEVGVDPVELAQERPHPPRLLGRLHVEQLLDGEDEDQFVVLEGEVVDPRGVRDRLPPGLGLHVLLEAGVQVADHRAEADDLLPVQVDDQAQDAVRRRVVRPEVDLEQVLALAELLGDLEDRRDRRGDVAPLVDPRALDGHRHYSSSEKRTGSPPIGIVLAQRVALPVVVHEDPRGVRVAFEADAEEVPDLALVPVRGRPDRDDALHRLAVVEPDLDAHPRSALAQREEVVVDREALRLRLGDSRVALGARGAALAAREVQVAAGARAVVAGHAAVSPAEVVGGADIRKEAEALDVAQMQAGLDQAGGVDDEGRLTVLFLRLD